MSKIGSTAGQKIVVNADGLFQVNGRALDMTALIYAVLSETKVFAQKRLSLTAQILFNLNEKSKQLISFLNDVRALRPTGEADATAEGDKLKKIVDKFYKTYHEDPLTKFDLVSLSKIDEPKAGQTGVSGYKYNTLKQAEVDQLIEGVKSRVSTLSTKQEMENNNTQKFERVSDEMNEGIAAIEKAVHSSYLTEEGKI